ncbi:uncharacterized protein I206_100481 [Kwoniella pini CBS 10737]|uniref:Uncharacterized protein n=1 Tax=Kwoniella pini CBS 10737 TaxID=1296096 RepID=A0A1B9IDN9_9TREE|nr:uncharacterized protein I206_00846 [Kwoniella pini CBS 10737]OCF53541.1 hypothetical protein I206_00846 [Kwoniella pini CBS 10737]
MKRLTSDSSSNKSPNDTEISSCYSPSPESEETKPKIPSTPKKRGINDKDKNIKKELTPSSKKVKTEKLNDNNGIWDGEKRSLFIDEIISIGYKNANLIEIAQKLGMNKRQLIDQLVPNKSNLRKKVIMAAKTM